MRTLYTFAINTYGLGVRIAALWNTKARLMSKGWHSTKEKTHLGSTLTAAPTAWFHASSLGEFEQARPVLEQFKKDHPEVPIVVSFFSPSGYEIRKGYNQADYVCYLPLDTPSNARRFIDFINPTIVFFVKYDFWFNYLGELKRRNIPTYIFSSIFRESQYFFKPYGKWFLNQLHSFDHLFVQNQESIQLLQSHGITECSIAGDTRFDRVFDIARHVKPNPSIERFVHPENGNDPAQPKVIIAGSSWEPDEKYLFEYFKSTQIAPLKLILAPHVISETHIAWIEQLFGKSNCVRYSQMGNAEATDRPVLIIDNMGMLSSIYHYSDIAYIGGGWGHGIHNILEALTFGKPVIFGPNYTKFKEAHDIIGRQGGFSYDTLVQLRTWIDKILSDSDDYISAVETCKTYVNENIGSTRQILDTVYQKTVL